MGKHHQPRLLRSQYLGGSGVSLKAGKGRDRAWLGTDAPRCVSGEPTATIDYFRTVQIRRIMGISGLKIVITASARSCNMRRRVRSVELLRLRCFRNFRRWTRSVPEPMPASSAELTEENSHRGKPESSDFSASYSRRMGGGLGTLEVENCIRTLVTKLGTPRSNSVVRPVRGQQHLRPSGGTRLRVGFTLPNGLGEDFGPVALLQPRV